MSVYKEAREVIAKWRERATEGPWKVIDGVYSDEGLTYDGSQIEAEHEMVAMDHQDLDCGAVAPLGYADARLIVGTAGNPDLLDALDGLLRHHEEEGVTVSAIRNWVRLMAEAIIRADKQMEGNK